jgi:hypothetical protein
MLTIASAAFYLFGCNRPASNANISQPSPTSERKAQVALAEPFKLGDASFSSHQAFVENITPRCATEEPPPAERRSIELSLQKLNEVSPQERGSGSVEIPV